MRATISPLTGHVSVKIGLFIDLLIESSARRKSVCS
ncbi:hypothetical protein ACVWXO_004461 [Bradyrhizobium sp. LM2.7]